MVEGERRVVVNRVGLYSTDIRARDAASHERASARRHDVHIEMSPRQQPCGGLGERTPVGRVKHDQLPTSSELRVREWFVTRDGTSGRAAALHV